MIVMLTFYLFSLLDIMGPSFSRSLHVFLSQSSHPLVAFPASLKIAVCVEKNLLLSHRLGSIAPLSLGGRPRCSETVCDRMPTLTPAVTRTRLKHSALHMPNREDRARFRRRRCFRQAGPAGCPIARTRKGQVRGKIHRASNALSDEVSSIGASSVIHQYNTSPQRSKYIHIEH